MKLLELLKDIPVLESNVSMDLEIGQVVYDSRKVTPGCLFVAVTGFAADMQPQLAAALCLAEGTSVVTEGVWENRFRYSDELRRMGAKIQVDGKVAVIEGVEKLTGAPVRASDLRAGAALVIAGLAAEGTTEIEEIGYIERGYEDIVAKLRKLGADISRVSFEDVPPIAKAN